MTETITRAELIDILSYALQVLKGNEVADEEGTMATDPIAKYELQSADD